MTIECNFHSNTTGQRASRFNHVPTAELLAITRGIGGAYEKDGYKMCSHRDSSHFDSGFERTFSSGLAKSGCPQTGTCGSCRQGGLRESSKVTRTGKTLITFPIWPRLIPSCSGSLSSPQTIKCSHWATLTILSLFSRFPRCSRWHSRWRSWGRIKSSRKIGSEPTGRPFNSPLAVVDMPTHTGNPLVNAGAIATTSLISGNRCRRQMEQDPQLLR